MKFPSFSFSREWKELNKFKSLSQEERGIVFYAENNASILHFKSIIDELTKEFDRQICYVTSSPNDILLSTSNKKIRTFFIGTGTVRTKFFITLKADVLIMDMPDLESFHIKRSKVYPVHYAYVFHSIFSVHSYLRKGAVDNYDTIFCVGPHHIKEIRASESVYGLKPKNLVECGYDRLDTLIEEHNQKKYSKVKDKKMVLIAPSFGPDNLLNTKGVEIIKVLLDADYMVTVRPHPVITKKSPEIIKKINDEFKGNPSFILETNISSYDSLHLADCMICDWSGISLEYAFAFERPVLFVDVPKKINNPDYKDIPFKPIEIKIRYEIGEVVSPQNIQSIPAKIELLLNNNEKIKKAIQHVRSKTVFNVGKAGKIGAKEIMKILENSTRQQGIKVN